MEYGVRKDVWGTYASELFNKKLFLFDMDGTIYEEDRVFEGTIELLQIIEEMGGRYVFITNNSSKSVNDYVLKLNKLGITCTRENFFTSAQATVLYLKKNYPDKKVYCQGTKSLVQELKDADIFTTENVEDHIDIIVVGFDTELTSEKLRNTCELLNRGLPFIATNPDLRCPVNFGYIPDCGSICSMLTAATDRVPIYIGKPEATMVNIVKEKYGYTSEETVVIGDRLYTDIATGLNAGVTAICVLTGEATKEDIAQGKIKPNLTFNSVNDICQVMRQLKTLKNNKK